MACFPRHRDITIASLNPALGSRTDRPVAQDSHSDLEDLRILLHRSHGVSSQVGISTFRLTLTEQRGLTDHPDGIQPAQLLFQATNDHDLTATPNGLGVHPLTS